MQIENEKLEDLIRLIRDANREITGLRRRNEILEAKVQVFDGMMLALRAPAIYGDMVASSLDVAYALDRAVEQIEKAIVEDKLPKPAVSGDVTRADPDDTSARRKSKY